MGFLADLVAELRDHHPDRVQPRLRLTDVLDGLQLAMPNDFGDEELASLIERAKREVPLYYGGNPDAPSLVAGHPCEHRAGVRTDRAAADR